MESVSDNGLMFTFKLLSTSAATEVLARNNVFDRNSFEHLNVAVSVKRYRALFMDA